MLITVIIMIAMLIQLSWWAGYSFNHLVLIQCFEVGTLVLHLMELRQGERFGDGPEVLQLGTGNDGCESNQAGPEPWL